MSQHYSVAKGLERTIISMELINGSGGRSGMTERLRLPKGAQAQ